MVITSATRLVYDPFTLLIIGDVLLFPQKPVSFLIKQQILRVHSFRIHGIRVQLSNRHVIDLYASLRHFKDSL